MAMLAKICLTLYVVLQLVLGLSIVNCKAKVFSKLQNGQYYPLRLFSSSRNDNDDDAVTPRNLDINISEQTRRDLDAAVSTLIATAAINTVSYYMLEFRDDVNSDWMMSFSNFKSIGFGNAQWTDYIENMIKLDKQAIQVIMKSTVAKNVKRGKNQSLGDPVYVQYTHELEPRKIAHRILTVKEDVSNEMINDVGCILFENKDAIRHANTRILSGKVQADKERKITRMTSQGESTPLRDKTYHDFSVMITNIAIDLLKSDLIQQNDVASINYLDNFILTITNTTDKTYAQSFFEELAYTKSLVEDLYYNGLTEGIQHDKVTNKPINIMKLADSLISYREGAAKAVIDVLKYNNMKHRLYYKMITDAGGFKKFDLSPAPKFTYLEEGIDEELKATMNERGIVLEAGSATIDNSNVSGKSIKNEDGEKDVNTAAMQEDNGSDGNGDEDDYLFADTNFDGPMLM